MFQHTCRSPLLPNFGPAAPARLARRHGRERAAPLGARWSFTIGVWMVAVALTALLAVAWHARNAGTTAPRLMPVPSERCIL